MEFQVSILLLNYNGKKFNQACIASILTQTYQHFEILFIDNASTDDSVAEVAHLFQNEIQKGKLRIIKNTTNEGFSQGNNIGHRLAKGEYICLLNNDTTVEKTRLEELVKVIEADSTVGAVGSLILDQGYEQEIKKALNKEEIGCLTVLGEYSSMRGTRLTLPNDTSMYYETTALSGNAILYRKNIVNQPFPERYFAYAEDVFFNLFLLISGHKMAFCPQSICHHYGSGSFGKKPSDFKLFHGNRNQIVNFFIFYQPTTILKLFPLFLLGQLGHLFINVPFKRLKAKLKARWRIFKHWHKVKALTYEVQKHKKLTDKQLLSLLSKDISSPEGNHGKFSSVQKKMIISVNKISHWYCKTILNI